MQTAPAYNPQVSYQMGASVPPSYYPSQSYIDPRGYAAFNPNLQQSFGYNYQPYYNESINTSYIPYYGMTTRAPQPQRQSAQYINPEYHYEYDPRYSKNRDARYHQRIQTFNIPINYSNRTGQLPNQPIKTVPNPNTNNPNVPLVKEVIYEQQPLNIPQSVRNVQYIPHLHRYMDYVQDRVKIPVEKYYTDYYQVEHVTDFVPRQYQDTVIQMVPQQIVRYRLQYVPVQRKIVHMPKNQIYDQNGLYKGVGNLADKVQIDQAAIGLVNEAQRRTQNQISRTIYQRNLNQIRGLDESLVDVIGKDIENQTRNEALINKNIYQNMKNNTGSPTLSQQYISRAVYDDMRGNINSPSRYGNSGEMLNEMLYKNMAQSKSRANYSAQGSRVSRRKTNFVTSDGYFPNYDDEMRNLGTSF